MAPSHGLQCGMTEWVSPGHYMYKYAWKLIVKHIFIIEQSVLNIELNTKFKVDNVLCQGVLGDAVVYK